MKHLTGVFALLFLGAASLSAQTSAQCNQNTLSLKLVCEMVQTELAVGQNGTNLRYKLVEIEGSKVFTYDVVETSEGTVRRLLLVDGREPSAVERLKDDAYLDKVLSDQATRNRLLKEAKEDAKQVNTMMTLLPVGFLYDPESVNGDVVRLRFRPNPQFKPDSRQTQVMHHLTGILSIDSKQKRLAGIEGVLMDDVKFGMGLLATLRKGGTFNVLQTQVVSASGNTPAAWAVTSMRIQIEGKALFFHSISEQQNSTMSGFAVVPPMSVAQGVNLLRVNLAAAKLGSKP